jgi:hypothetical protein
VSDVVHVPSATEHCFDPRACECVRCTPRLVAPARFPRRLRTSPAPASPTSAARSWSALPQHFLCFRSAVMLRCQRALYSHDRGYALPAADAVSFAVCSPSASSRHVSHPLHCSAPAALAADPALHVLRLCIPTSLGLCNPLADGQVARMADRNEVGALPRTCIPLLLEMHQISQQCAPSASNFPVSR